MVDCRCFFDMDMLKHGNLVVPYVQTKALNGWCYPSLGATRILSSASERTSWGSSGGVESNLTIQTADAIWKFSWMVYNGTSC